MHRHVLSKFGCKVTSTIITHWTHDSLLRWQKLTNWTMVGFSLSRRGVSLEFVGRQEHEFPVDQMVTVCHHYFFICTRVPRAIIFLRLLSLVWEVIGGATCQTHFPSSRLIHSDAPSPVPPFFSGRHIHKKSGILESAQRERERVKRWILTPIQSYAAMEGVGRVWLKLIWDRKRMAWHWLKPSGQCQHAQ